jgi:hypothetical protein
MTHIKPVMISTEEEQETILYKISMWWYMDSWIYNSLYQYSWLYNLRWKVTHYIKKTNWIRTNLPTGYYDIEPLMEDGIFSLVEGYIAKNEEDAWRYGSEPEVQEDIIDILHFYRVRKPETEKKMDKLLHELYGDTVWEVAEIAGRKNVRTRKHSDKYTEEERENMFNEHTELEDKLNSETTEMLKKCIDIRAYLWT